MVREVFTRAERKDRLIRAMQVKRETMTPAEIDRAMRKAIREALDARGAVEKEDILRANIPESAIAPRFATILKEVLAERSQ